MYSFIMTISNKTFSCWSKRWVSGMKCVEGHRAILNYSQVHTWLVQFQKTKISKYFENDGNREHFYLKTTRKIFPLYFSHIAFLCIKTKHTTG